MRKLTPDRNKTAKFDDIGIDNLIDCVCELLEDATWEDFCKQLNFIARIR